MILVTLGTQDKPMPRLLEYIEELIKKGSITDEVIVQAGYTKFQSNNMKIFDLIPMDELEVLTKKADIVITHGGVGSIIAPLKLGKKVIACPRLKKFNEHTNNHQLQIIDSFSKSGFILALYDDNTLAEVLEKASTFVPNTFTSNTNNMINLIDNYITDVFNK